MRLLCCLPVLLLALPASAGEGDAKREKVQELMRLQGLYETMEQVQGGSVARYNTVIEEQIAKSLSGDKRIPTEVVLEARLIARQVFQEMMGSMNASEAVDVYVENYGKNLSVEELDEIIAYWSSPLGQKELEASRAAMGPFMEFISAQTAQAMDEAIRTYKERLGAYIEEYKANS